MYLDLNCPINDLSFLNLILCIYISDDEMGSGHCYHPGIRACLMSRILVVNMVGVCNVG